MVAYSFHRQFVLPIKAGTKHQTFRLDRKRHARPGEALQLFTAMRTRFCEKIIPDPVCTAVLPVRFLCIEGRIDVVEIDGTVIINRDAMAVADGFPDFDGMRQFWWDAHGPLDLFRGFLIQWTPPVAALAEEAK